MDKAVMLLVEKEQYDDLLDKYHKQTELTFRRVGKKSYRVFNNATGRFHNPELGIDEVV